MQPTPTRRRPRLNTTVAAETLATLDQVRRDAGLPNVGVTIDYMANDYQRRQRTAGEPTPVTAVTPRAA